MNSSRNIFHECLFLIVSVWNFGVMHALETQYFHPYIMHFYVIVGHLCLCQSGVTHSR